MIARCENRNQGLRIHFQRKGQPMQTHSCPTKIKTTIGQVNRGDDIRLKGRGSWAQRTRL